eukprot:6011654-Pyramimonas_sp.AAC.1
MSGGWRGFAIDQRLVVGDAVVFEKLPGLRSISPVTVRVPLLAAVFNSRAPILDASEPTTVAPLTLAISVP